VYIIIRKFVLQFFIFTSFLLLLPCPTAPASICASHLLTGTLEVPTNSLGACEFCFGQGSVLLDGHPSAQPVLGRVQSSHPKHVGSALLTLSVDYWGLGQWAPLTNALLTSRVSAVVNYARPVIMNRDH
jgi:hypothetical protein